MDVSKCVMVVATVVTLGTAHFAGAGEAPINKASMVAPLPASKTGTPATPVKPSGRRIAPLPVAYSEAADGVKVSFKIVQIGNAATKLGGDNGEVQKMARPYRLMVRFSDPEADKPLEKSASVTIAVVSPDGSRQSRDLVNKGKHFAAAFDLKHAGEYQIVCDYRIDQGKPHTIKFKHMREM